MRSLAVKPLATLARLALVWLFCVGPYASVIAVSAAPDGQRQPVVWHGPDGESLPFRSDEEILDFLRLAEVVSLDSIPVGVTRPRIGVLERDGVTARATFKTIEEDHWNVTLSDGSHYARLRDSFQSEVAAYLLARWLGLDNVPPTTLRRIRSERGSLQLWVEGGMTETDRRERGIAPPDSVRWLRQTNVIDVFDDLIGNVDRNQGDIVIAADWRLWMIDHSRAFQLHEELLNAERIIFCERRLWDRLQRLEFEQAYELIGEFVSRYQVEALLERRDALVKHIRDLISARGEDVVLFQMEETRDSEPGH